MKNGLINRIMIRIALWSILLGHGTVSGQTVAINGNIPAYNGPRHTIAVGEFKADASKARRLSRPLRTTLEAALHQSNYFDVLDRTDYDPMDGEREQGNFGSVLRGAYKVFGHITAVEETNQQSIKIPLGDRRNNISIGGKQATIRMTAKIVHVRTGRVVAHREIQTKSNNSQFSLNLGNNRNVGNFSNQSKNPVDLAAMNAVYELTRFVCDSMKAIPAPGSAKNLNIEVLMVLGKEVVINAGHNQQIQIGDELGLIDDFGFPVSGFKARVIYLQPDRAKCLITESSMPVKEGSKLVSL